MYDEALLLEKLEQMAEELENGGEVFKNRRTYFRW